MTAGPSQRLAIPGIHHVTAIAGDPQRNVDFYYGILGLRLVKKTVNFDDPGSYHLYYGDGIGSPGTIMTFFAWPGAYAGRRGTGQLTVTSFAVPAGSLGYWRERLREYGIQVADAQRRLEEEYLALEDFDGLALELVANPEANSLAGWQGGPVPEEHAVRGFYGVTLSERGYESTARLLTETMGFRPAGEAGNRFRYRAKEGELGNRLDVVCEPEGRHGQVAVGTVHHVAWRAADDREQGEWRRRLVELGLDVTPVIDRQYFHSIYFHEPGGVLFEVATDPPGFTLDEAREELGGSLRLPPWLESRRALVERHLQPIAPRPLPPPADLWRSSRPKAPDQRP